MTLTPEDIGAVLGPTDETLVNDLIQTGATREELAEAWALHNPVKALEVPERHHFNVVDALIEDDQPLRQILLALLRDGQLP